MDEREAAIDAEVEQAFAEREAELDEREAAISAEEQRAAASRFGDGVHVVGEDIEAGTYRTEGSDFCYWARLSGLSGEFDDIIANGTPTGPATVEIATSDVAFESQGCGTWERG